MRQPSLAAFREDLANLPSSPRRRTWAHAKWCGESVEAWNVARTKAY